MPPTAEQVRDEYLYRLSEGRQKGLRAYSKAIWPILEPATPLAWGWYHDAICDHLAAVTAGDIRKVIINIPPRHSKSTLVSVAWPTWVWGPADYPESRWLFCSYAQSRSLEDAMRRRRVFGHPWYLAGWGDKVRIGQDRWTSDGSVRYSNSATGHQFATSVKGGNTGEGGDIIVVDDAHNMKEIMSDTVRESVVEWWRGTMSTRLNQQATGSIVHVAQRGHEMDLCGWLLASDKEYVHLNLPAEFVLRRRCFTAFDNGQPFFADPRQHDGDLLDPIRHPQHVLETLKITLGDAYERQFQQNPQKEEGGILKRAWWRYWAPMGHSLVGTLDINGRPVLSLPRRFPYMIDSWDCAFKDEETSSHVVGQKWGLEYGDSGQPFRAYLLDQRRDLMDFIRTVGEVSTFYRSHRQTPDAVFVEDKANGTAVIRTLRDAVPGLLPSDVEDSKVARAHAMSPRVKAGNYALPHPGLPGMEWVAGTVEQWQSGFLEPSTFLHETSMFPNASYDDQVDTLTQADRHLFQLDHFSEENFGSGTGGSQDAGVV